MGKIGIIITIIIIIITTDVVRTVVHTDMNEIEFFEE